MLTPHLVSRKLTYFEVLKRTGPTTEWAQSGICCVAWKR